jgi:RNA polymerase-binding transcription factor DksA
MSGLAGSDDESIHALILNENAIHAVRVNMAGHIHTHCVDCGYEIPAARVAFLKAKGMKCERCVSCQEVNDKLPKPTIKMLDRIL